MRVSAPPEVLVVAIVWVLLANMLGALVVLALVYRRASSIGRLLVLWAALTVLALGLYVVGIAGAVAPGSYEPLLRAVAARPSLLLVYRTAATPGCQAAFWLLLLLGGALTLALRRRAGRVVWIWVLLTLAWVAVCRLVPAAAYGSARRAEYIRAARAARQSPKDLVAQVEYARLLRQLGDPARALRVLSAGRWQEHPQRYLVLNEMGLDNLSAGEPTAAADLLREALSSQEAANAGPGRRLSEASYWASRLPPGMGRGEAERQAAQWRRLQQMQRENAQLALGVSLVLSADYSGAALVFGALAAASPDVGDYGWLTSLARRAAAPAAAAPGGERSAARTGRQRLLIPAPDPALCRDRSSAQSCLRGWGRRTVAGLEPEAGLLGRLILAAG